MALDFEELVQQLLYDVALAGKIGLGIAELGSAVKAQYDAHLITSGESVADVEEDILFSSAPPQTGIQKLDDDLVELTWQWLSTHKEVKIRSVLIDQPGESSSVDPGNDTTSPSTNAGAWSVSPTLLQKHEDLRLTTGETRIWQAIAGHGPDYKRLPLMEFELLSIIAAYGAKGIFQPQLVRLSGQDKRSVPMRTDRLTKKGYITKESVIALKVKTSLLKLTRFTVDASALAEVDKAHKTIIIRYDAWFSEFVRLMKENNNIMAFEDMRIGLGINGKKYETKTLHRCIRRLAQVGCLRKVTAREAGNEYDPHAKVRHTRALQLLREPNDLDRQAFTKSVRGQGSRLTTGAIAPLGEEDDGRDDADSEFDAEDLEDGGTVEEAEDVAVQHYDTKPIWTPDLHLANLLYRCIEEAGMAGIGSTDLYRLSVGPLWKRAVDDTLIRLTAAWHLSQPSHLRHLAIVRDSSQSSGAPTYHYRTYDNFQKAVDAGHVAWDYSGARARAGPMEGHVVGPTGDSVIDAWGFSVVPSKLLVHGTGDATLAECATAAHLSEVNPIVSKSKRHTSDTPERQKRKYTKRPTSFEVPQVFYTASAAAAIDQSTAPPAKVTPAKRKRVMSDVAMAKRLRKNDDATQIEFARWAHSTALHLAQAEVAIGPSSSLAKPGNTQDISLQADVVDLASEPSNILSPEELVQAAKRQRDLTAQALRDFDATAPPRKRGAPSKAAKAEMERRVITRKTLTANASAAIATLAALTDAINVGELPLPDVAGSTKQAAPSVTAHSVAAIADLLPTISASVGTQSTTAPVAEEGDNVHSTPVGSDASFEERVTVLEAELLARAKPGVYINPPAASALKANTMRMEGRWPKAKIVVIRSERLRNLPWFDDDEVAAAPSEATVNKPPKRKIPAEHAADDAGFDVEMQELEALSSTAARKISRKVEMAGRIDDSGQVERHAPRTPARSSIQELDAGYDSTNTPEARSATPSQDAVRVSSAPTSGRLSQAATSKQTRQVDLLGPGNLLMKRRQIIINIMSACGDIFPGKNEIWYPFTTIWFAQYKQRPDKKTVEGVVKGLVQSGKIKRLVFTFRSAAGFNVERAIICMPDVDPQSAPVKDLQARISAVYPATYLPPDVNIDPNLRATIGLNTQLVRMEKMGLATQKLSASGVSEVASSLERLSKKLPPHYIRDNFVKDPRVTVKRAFPAPPTPETASSRKRQKLDAMRPRKLFGDVDSSDDDEQPVPAAQAALQGQLHLTAYQHEFDALSVRTATAKYKRIIDMSRTRLGGPGPGKRGLPGRRLMKRPESVEVPLLEQGYRPYLPSVLAHTNPNAAHGLEPVFSQPQVHDFDRFRTQIRSTPQTETKAIWHRHTLPAVAPASLQTSSMIGKHLASGSAICTAPQSMRDILGRELPINPKDSEDATIRFLYEVARIETWEINVVERGVLLVPGDEAYPFIKYTAPRMDYRSQAEAKARRRLAREMQLARSRHAKEAAKLAWKYGSHNEKMEMQKGSWVSTPKDAMGITPKLKQRDRRAVFAFLEKDYDRLTKAVSLMMTVVGGLAGKLNWMIVQHAFRYRYTSEFLRHRWDRVRTERIALVIRLQEMLWEPFLEAYEAGDLPNIDFQDVEKTDWPALLDWVEGEVLVGSCKNLAGKDDPMNKLPELPRNVGTLVEDFEIAKLDGHPGPDFNGYYSSVTQKGKDAIANLAACISDVQKELIRTWARAIALTDDKNYDLNAAHTKITQFGDAIVDEVCKEMCVDEILHLKKVGRRLPGRNFEIHQNFWRVFSKWSKTNEIEFMYLRTIAKRREEILQRLENEDSIVLSLDAPEDEILVLTNMVAQGLLQVTTELPPRNDDFDAPFPRINAFGYSGLNYNVRSYDRTRLRFPVIYEKTDAFTTEHGLIPDIPIPTQPPLRPGETVARTPLWIDVHGNILPRVWELVLRSLLYLVVYRPGISAEAVQDSHKGKLGAWEAKLALQWMEATGLAERVEADREEDCGWRVSEWWYCALVSEIALWPAADAGTAKRDPKLTGEEAVDLTAGGEEDAEIAD
nr:hypothetical protein B0A51_16644 [Rachicladosporium sp. CCFEE 5018]